MGKEIHREQSANPEGLTPQEVTFTPQEIGFIKDAKKIIGRHLTSTILFVSAALAGAGIVAIKESDSFNPLTNSVDSANHLVLNNLHKSYEQLIDVLPKVEDAEANPINIVTNLGVRPAGTAGTIARFQFDDFTHLVVGSFNAAPGWNCTARTNPGDTVNGDKFNCFTYCNNPVPAIGGALNIAFFNTAKDLHVTSQVWGSLWPAPAGAGAGAQAQEGSAAGGCGGGVGGIAELPDVEAFPLDINSEKSDDYTTPIAAGVVAATGIITAAGALLYSRRNHSSK